MSHRFEVLLTWEIEDDIFIPVRVIGRKTAQLPAIRPGWNDPGSPAEGGELEDLNVYSGSRLPSDTESRLLSDDRFIRAVEAAL